MDAKAWDERYGTSDYVWKVEPNVILAAEAADLRAGSSLDLACGEGRNTVWLAERGWRATGVDFSAVGIDKARRLAADRGVEVEWECADVRSWVPPPTSEGKADEFDLVTVCYLHLPAVDRRQVMAVAARALAPGATMLVVAHDARNFTEGVGGPRSPEVLYGPTDVLADLERAGVGGLSVERAETVERAVEGSDRPALDCLVRVRRAAGATGPSGGGRNPTASSTSPPTR